jgi:hypothetical protein
VSSETESDVDYAQEKLINKNEKEDENNDNVCNCTIITGLQQTKLPFTVTSDLQKPVSNIP